jgi:hypothetical protein
MVSQGVSAIARVESSFIDIKTAVAVFTKDRLSIGTFGSLEEVHVRSVSDFGLHIFGYI